MLTLALAATLSAAQPLPATTADGRDLPSLKQAASSDGSERMSTAEELRFRRLNRLPALGALLSIGGGVALTFGLGVNSVSEVRGPIPPGTYTAVLLAGGITSLLTAPFVSSYGAFRASAVLRRSGIPSPVFLASTGTLLLGVTPVTFGLTYPMGMLFNLAQSAQNRRRFVQSHGSPPQRVPVRVTQLLPMAKRDQVGLALTGTW
jgi:hypothetical protein